MEGAVPTDDIQAFVLGMGMRARAASVRHDKLVEEAERIAGLNPSGHDALQIADLPEGGRIIGLHDKAAGRRRILFGQCVVHPVQERD